VTRVEVSPDMRQAKVYVSIMGSEAQQKLCLHGLRSSAGYLQSKISDRIDTRYTPRLQFMIDEGVKKSLAINQLLSELLPKENASPEDAAAEMPPDDET
jgi:ribosome-binding factor A